MSLDTPLRVSGSLVNNLLIRRFQSLLTKRLYFTLLFICFSQVAFAQWLSGYDYRKEITLDGTDIAGDLTDFPVLISITDADLATHALANGHDIVFTDDTHAPLHHDLESFDSGTGAVVAWVKVGLTDAADETIYMYFGNASASDPAVDAFEVWDGDFVGVWHMADTDDESSATNNLTAVNTPTSITGGKLGAAYDFNNAEESSTGDKHAFLVSDDGDLDLTDAVTMSAWIYIESFDEDYARVILRNDVDRLNQPYTAYGLHFDNMARIQLKLGVDDGSANGQGRTTTYTTPLSTGQWYHLAGTYDRTTGRLYVNGTEVNTLTDTDPLRTSNEPFSIGRRYHTSGGGAGSGFFDGIIDEVRLSSTARSAEWIATEYANQNNPGVGGFLSSVGTLESSGGGFVAGYAYRKKITLDGAEIIGSHTDFPVLVSLTSDTDLAANVQNSNGYDIVFADDDGTVLSHELESYDDGTGALVAWVTTDLTASTDKEIFMNYGNASIATDPSRADTWDGDYIGVWHLDDDYVDGTNYNHDITTNTTTNLSSGVINAGESFDGASAQYMEVTTDSDFNLSTALTLSAWVQPDGIDDWDRIVLRNMDDPTTYHTNYGIFFTGGGGSSHTVMFEMTHVGGATYTESTTAIPENATDWYYVTATYDGSRRKIYINGVEEDDGAETRALYTPPVDEPFLFGRRQHGGGVASNEFDGDMDEVRLSRVARSGNWILTEYNNQSDPSGFIKLLGSEEVGCVVNAGTVSAAVGSVGSGGATTITATGYDGLATLQWQSSTDNTNFSDIGGETSSTLNTGALTQTTYFRIAVTNGCTQYSSSAAVSVTVSTPAGYEFRKKITLDGAEIVGSHTEFPALISITSDADLASNVQNANGYDILFTDADGSTILPHQLESFNSGTGELLAWVKVDLTDATDKELYIYYGNSSISADPSATATWRSSYVGVWHLGSDYEDATSFANHASSYTSTNTTGKIGDADDFVRTAADNGQGIEIADGGASDELDMTTAFTLSAWFNPDQLFASTWERIVAKSNETNSNPWSHYAMTIHDGNDAIRVEVGQGTQSSSNGTTAITTGAGWYYGVVTYNGSALTAYLNGNQEGTPTALTGSLDQNDQPLSIGKSSFNGNDFEDFFDGQIDEVRVANVAHNAGWIQTEYYNQNDAPGFIKDLGTEETLCVVATGTLNADQESLPDGGNTNIAIYSYEPGATLQWQSSTDNINFSDVGGETTATLNTGALSETTYYRVVVTSGCSNYSESIQVTVGGTFLGGYAYRKKITFAGSDIAGIGTHDDFPMLVRLASDADLQAAVTSANGYDIVFTDADGSSPLDHELEHYDNSTGALAAWVNVDLDGGVDKEIYMYYGNATVTTNQSSTNTWSGDFAGVWHLHDDFLDATTNDNDGTNTGTDDATGIIGDAQDFENGDAADGIDLPNMDVNGNVVTLSAWINVESGDPNDPRVISKADGCCDGDHIWKLGLRTARNLRSRFSASGSGEEDQSSVVPIGSWQFVQAVFDGDRVRHYLNGVQVANNDHAGTVIDKDGTMPVAIGQDPFGNDNNFDGLIDEVRVLNVVRSEEWLLTEYNNQRDGSTSLTLGSEESGCSVTTGTLSAIDTNIPSGESTVLRLSGYDPGSTFQWQASDDNVIFSDISLATADTLATGVLTASKFFRVQVTSCSTEATNALMIGVSGDFLAGYNFRKRLIFRGSEIVGSHTDFPLLVRLDSDTDLATHVQNANGYDIVFTEVDGTSMLKHELELFDDNTGQLVAWVSTDLADDTNKEIYMYYGNPSISTDQSNTDTWDNGFAAAWHMNGDSQDATINGNDAIKTGTSNDTGVMASSASFNGTSSDYMTVPDDASLALINAFSITAWVKPDAGMTGSPGVFMRKRVSDNVGGLSLEAKTAGPWWGIFAYNGTWEKALTPSNSIDLDWTYLAATFDGASMKIYRNGVEEDDVPLTAPIGTPSPMTTYIGRNDNPGFEYYFDGLIDELRVATLGRSEGWVQTEYYNQRPDAAMMILGDAEWSCDLSPTGSVASSMSGAMPGETVDLVLTNYDLASSLQWQSSTDGTNFTDVAGATSVSVTSPAIAADTYFRVQLNNGTCDAYSDTLAVPIQYDFIDGYSHRLKLIVPSANVSGVTDTELTNFPLLVDITHDSLRSVANGGHVYNANGYELQFVGTDGTTLSYERESYAPGTGALRAWVNIPELSTSTDTEFFLYYGNCSSPTDPSSTAAWNSDYGAVFHMEDMSESTLNGYNATNNGTTSTTGPIGSAREFVRAESDFIAFPTSTNLLRNVEAATLSAWVNVEDLVNRQIIVGVSKGDSGPTNLSRGSLEYSDGGASRFRVGGRQRDTGGVFEGQQTTGAYTNTTDWYYVVGILDYRDKYMKIYVDGDEVATTVVGDGSIDWPGNSTDNTASYNGAIGAEDDGAGSKYFDGLIDEVRISHIERSADWIKTEFDNQSAPGSFLIVSQEETQFQWTGDTDSDWHDISNWSSCLIPTDTTAVRIPDVTNDPLLSGTVTIDDLTIESGALMSLGAATVNITGSIVNDGTIAAGTSDITFNGDANQTYAGTSSDLNDVDINKANGSELLLFDPITIDGTLNLAAGYITLAGGNLNLNNGPLIGGSPQSFVVTPNASCLRQLVDNAEVLFAVGVTPSSYSPAILNNAGTSDIFCIRVIDNVFPNGGESGTPFDEGVVGKTWFIEEDVAGGSDVTLTLQWRNADQKSAFSRSEAKITHFNSGLGSWEVKTSGAVSELGSGRFGLTATNITDFSPFSVGSTEETLPVELLIFDAQRVGQQVFVSWTTASETNNDFFTVQRGLSQSDFETLSNIPGQGTTKERTEYKYVDHRPLPGNTYYRLKQTDYDGSFTFSNILLVQDGLARSPELNIYPNANNGIDFNWSLQGLVPNTGVDIALYDLQGNLLRYHRIQLDASGNFIGKGFENLPLDPGMYLLRAANEGEEMVSRLIVK